ncbi:MFS transporter [Yunchengibacter salinarum]|uniref:MFS transporter n=1 Tax=Yunchengibacter salinarum TaxID=3133399 RepID=UPI0035B5FC05
MTHDPGIAPARDRLSILRLIAYAAPSFPIAAGLLALQVYVPTYFGESTPLTLATIGTVLLAARLWDMVTDPLIGWLSDRTPRHLGRRRVWVLAGAPLLLLAAFKLFLPPVDPGWGYLLVWTVLIYLAGTMLVVPLYAWGSELTGDYHERSRLSGARVITGLTAVLVTLSLPVVLDGASRTALGPALNATAWLVAGTLVAALALLIWQVPDRGGTPTRREGPFGALMAVLRVGPARRLLIAFTLNATANAIPATLFLMFAGRVLEGGDKVGVWLFLYFACAAAGVPLWVWLSARIGKHRSWAAGLVIASLSFVWVPFLGPGDHLFYLLIVVISGFATGADLAMPSALQADIVDWDAADTGQARPGQFFALWGMASKLAFALAVGITFPLLDLAGFDAGADDNSAFSKLVLALLYGVAPVILKGITLALIIRYPLTRAVHEANRARLAARVR